MANTYALGGSPLGLINVKSRPERTGMSSFNGGKSRNINVFSYNRGVPQPANIQVGGKEAYAPLSLMSGGSLPQFWPNADVGKIGGEQDSGGVKEKTDKNQYEPAKGKGISANFHNDGAYDTSLLNVLEKLSKTKSAALRPQDFAYCKYLGVYPNNRLMIARRFPAASKDNIFGKGGQSPKAILISWKPETEDFLEFTFGEEWVDADADFTNVLNKLGKDFGIDNAGQGLSKAINLIPLPGFTEQLQKEILVKLGVIESNSLGDPLPSGNPNLIKMAKRRKTIGYGEAGAGLKCAIIIKMSCEYEQKFISGIDPSTAWQDILNNIMIFGTSNSSNYGLSKSFESNLNKWMTNPGILVKTVIQAVKTAVSNIINTIETEATKALKNLNDAISPAKEKTGEEKEKENSSLVNKAKKQLNKFFNKITKAAFKTISKYKIEIMGIANALSGSPSTPWHITLGNPIRPFFCSGDMLTTDITVKFGPQLAFNDLPSSIKVEFTLTNARPLGMQEILGKFNMGSLRTVNIRKDFVEAEIPDDDGAAEFALENWQSTYFDGIFDQYGTNMVPESGGQSNQGTSPSTAGSNTGPGGNTTNQNQLETGVTVSVFVIGTPSTPGGTPSITIETKTLKDSGSDVALLTSGDGQLVQGVDPNSSVFSSPAFNTGPPF